MNNQILGVKWLGSSYFLLVGEEETRTTFPNQSDRKQNQVVTCHSCSPTLPIFCLFLPCSLLAPFDVYILVLLADY